MLRQPVAGGCVPQCYDVSWLYQDVLVTLGEAIPHHGSRIFLTIRWRKSNKCPQKSADFSVTPWHHMFIFWHVQELCGPRILGMISGAVLGERLAAVFGRATAWSETGLSREGESWETSTCLGWTFSTLNGHCFMMFHFMSSYFYLSSSCGIWSLGVEVRWCFMPVAPLVALAIWVHVSCQKYGQFFVTALQNLERNQKKE